METSPPGHLVTPNNTPHPDPGRTCRQQRRRGGSGLSGAEVAARYGLAAIAARVDRASGDVVGDEGTADAAPAPD
jgi:hypothetical protein